VVKAGVLGEWILLGTDERCSHYRRPPFYTANYPTCYTDNGFPSYRLFGFNLDGRPGCGLALEYGVSGGERRAIDAHGDRCMKMARIVGQSIHWPHGRHAFAALALPQGGPLATVSAHPWSKSPKLLHVATQPVHMQHRIVCHNGGTKGERTAIAFGARGLGRLLGQAERIA
jgi:hypothetical protein